MSATRIGAALLLASAIWTSAQAQPADTPPPGCRAWNADLPAAWSGWANTPMPVVAAATPQAAMKAAIAVGQKIAVMLAPLKSARMAVETPDIDPPKDAHQGMLSFRVPADGYYWIASSEGLWIDVVQNGAIQDSTDHGPGPHCASVRKAVQFMLKTGDALLQVSDNMGPKVELMIVRQP